jgi:hypothetical protein
MRPAVLALADADVHSTPAASDTEHFGKHSSALFPEVDTPLYW